MKQPIKPKTKTAGMSPIGRLKASAPAPVKKTGIMPKTAALRHVMQLSGNPNAYPKKKK